MWAAVRNEVSALTSVPTSPVPWECRGIYCRSPFTGCLRSPQCSENARWKSRRGRCSIFTEVQAYLSAATGFLSIHTPSLSEDYFLPSPCLPSPLLPCSPPSAYSEMGAGIPFHWESKEIGKEFPEAPRGLSQPWYLCLSFPPVTSATHLCFLGSPVTCHQLLSPELPVLHGGREGDCFHAANALLSLGPTYSPPALCLPSSTSASTEMSSCVLDHSAPHPPHPVLTLVTRTECSSQGPSTWQSSVVGPSCHS